MSTFETGATIEGREGYWERARKGTGEPYWGGPYRPQYRYCRCMYCWCTLQQPQPWPKKPQEKNRSLKTHWKVSGTETP